MSKPTPGPWTIGTPNNKVECDIGIHGGDDDAYIICDMQTDGYSDATQEANAQLISAAPDLLEALYAVDNAAGFSNQPLPPNVRDKVRAAILKAEGERREQ